MVHYRLENLVLHAELVEEQLYKIKDKESEQMYLQEFDNNQTRLRDLGYQYVADAFLLQHSHYQEYRIEHDFTPEFALNIKKVIRP